MAISIGSNSSSTGSRGSGISSRLDFSNVMSLAKDFRAAYETQKTEMEKERSAIEQLRYELQNDKDSDAYQTFMNFYQPLSDEIANFSKYGIRADTIGNFNNFKDQYTTKIAPIYEAAKRRLALEQIQENYRNGHPDDNIFYENDAHSISIDDFVNNPHLTSGKIISAKTLLTQVAGVGEMLRAQGGLPTGDKEADGVTPKMDKITVTDVNNFLNTYIDYGNYDPNKEIWNRNGNSKVKNEVMGSIMENITRNAGITDEDAPWIDEGTKRSIRQYISTGLYQSVTDNKTSSSGGSTSSSSDGSDKRTEKEIENDPSVTSPVNLNLYTNSNSTPLYNGFVDRNGNPMNRVDKEKKPISGVYAIMPRTGIIDFYKRENDENNDSPYNSMTNITYLFDPDDSEMNNNPLEVAVVVYNSQPNDGGPYWVKYDRGHFYEIPSSSGGNQEEQTTKSVSVFDKKDTNGNNQLINYSFSDDNIENIKKYVSEKGQYIDDFKKYKGGDKPHLYAKIINNEIVDVHIWDSGQKHLSDDRNILGVGTFDGIELGNKKDWYMIGNEETSSYDDAAKLVREALGGEDGTGQISDVLRRVDLSKCEWNYVKKKEIDLRKDENGNYTNNYWWYAAILNAYGNDEAMIINYTPENQNYEYYICFKPNNANLLNMTPGSMRNFSDEKTEKK